ncbi:MAG: HEPN domain-containing protein [Leptospiraceae bacterium]|jgi:HEPN domain-containing protein|nr:HEPN domain-containing protein [Leptospiraceae bacterium]
MNDKVQHWFIKSFEDYMTIKILIDSPLMEYTTSIICFHCQQMVEKLLKGFLTFHNMQFSKTHLLENLKQKCIEIDEEFQKLDFKNLSMYAVEIRYPDELNLPSIVETNQYVKIAFQTKDFILSKLNITEEKILQWIKETKQKEEIE